MNVPQLPVTRHLTFAYVLSFLIAFLVAALSLAGLLFPFTVYPTEELRRSFMSNDLVNLLIELPILLGSMALSQRGKLIGLLFWPGALFYVIYNSIAYTIAMSFNLMFLPYLVLLALSVYMIFGLLCSMDLADIEQRLKGTVPERFAGGVLIGFGGLFFIRAAVQIVSTLTGQVSFTRPELAILVADVLITPAWIIGGLILWRRQVFGYITGVGLLFQTSMLFIGLLIFFILQPFLAGVSFPVADFVVIFAMGLVCFVPFGLFVRGILSVR